MRATRSPKPRRALKGIPQELGRPPVSPEAEADLGSSAKRRSQAAGGREGSGRRSEERTSLDGETGCQGQPEAPGMGEEGSYDPIVPRKVGNAGDRGPTGGKG